MAAKRGTCDLPLHYGSAPKWLFERMVRLSGQIISAVITEYGPDEFIERMSDPYWFQAFGCVLGFDWHSSGLTTTVCGAVKEALRVIGRDFSVYAAGGKGATSRKTPDEIEGLIERFTLSLDAGKFIYASRMSAKVDNTALQDGYQLYQHSFFFSGSGKWAVVQQGMNTDTRWARRYHWHSEGLEDFVNEPEKAICCDRKASAFNMVARESLAARDSTASLSCKDPDTLLNSVEKFSRLSLPREHSLFIKDLRRSSLKKVLLSTYEKQPANFESLLGIEGVGPKTVRSLALLAELIYDVKVSRRDPVKYSFAHGGKDGYPYTISREHYDRSIGILEGALKDARLGNSEKRDAFKRLARFS